MADNREKIDPSNDSEIYVDEIKAEDYNFYVLNNILSQNIILQSYLNENGTVNSFEKCFINLTPPSNPREVLSDSKQEKSDVPLSSTALTDLKEKAFKNEGESPRVALKDTFLEDVLSASTKSFIERVSKSHISKDTLKKTLSHSACSEERSASISGSSSRTPCSPAVSLDIDLRNSVSSTTQTLDDRYSDSVDTSPFSVTLGTKTYSEEEKKHIGTYSVIKKSRNMPQKRKEKSCNRNNPYNVQKKVKVFSPCSSSSSQNIIKNDYRQELNCATDTEATTTRDKCKSVNCITVHQTNDKSQELGGDVKGNMQNEAPSVRPSHSSCNNCAVTSEVSSSDDFEWTIENLQLFGLALPEDSDVNTSTDATKSSKINLSSLETCPYGCRDLMSSDHLYHLHLSAMKLSQKETTTAESSAEPAKCKSETLCHIKSKVFVSSRENSTSNVYNQNENTQDKNIKSNSVFIGRKSPDLLINITDSKDSSNETLLNGMRRETILKSNLKSHDQVEFHFCEKSECHESVKPSVSVQCGRNPCNKSGVPQSLSCTNIGLSGTTTVSQGPNNNVAARNAAVSNNPYAFTIAPASASSHFYKPDCIYEFGSMTNDNYMQLEPFSMPNASMWFGKQAHPQNTLFSTTNVSPHVMNSPWYQQWFHAMNMRRSMASQVPSPPYNYFEPLKMNHYRKSLWETPNIGQQRMYQRTGSTMGSLPRMFQTPFLHSCFPATISSSVHQAGAQIQCAEKQAKTVTVSQSQVQDNQPTSFEKPNT